VNPIKLFSIRLGARHVSIGSTNHYRDGGLLPKPCALEIVRYENQAGIFLNYLDQGGDAQTDTWHQSLEDAFHQARTEFGVEDNEWAAHNENSS
jgi:hypothetical protein